MRKVLIASAFIFALGSSSAFANGDVGAECTSVTESGDIELPEGMSVADAAGICSCIGDNASGDVAEEFLASFGIFGLDERMSSLSEDAMGVFESCV